MFYEEPYDAANRGDGIIHCFKFGQIHQIGPPFFWGVTSMVYKHSSKFGTDRNWSEG